LNSSPAEVHEFRTTVLLLLYFAGKSTRYAFETYIASMFKAAPKTRGQRAFNCTLKYTEHDLLLWTYF
jgi:hypothetical protein